MMQRVKHFIKGVVIGSTMMVPGVSGGTMALILGIYDDLIHSISSFFKDVKKNLSFLMVVGIGGLLGLISISFIVDYGLKNFEYPVKFLFLGIVIGGMPVLFKEADTKEKHWSDYLYAVIGVLIILLFSLFNSETSVIDLSDLGGTIQVLTLFITGIVIAIALILPGISTSFLLLTLGLYEPLLEAIKTIDFGFLMPIVIGVAFGVITTTKILENFLNKKPRQTYLLIIGFVLASTLEVFPGIPKGLDLLYAPIAFIIGYIIIRFVSIKYAD
ncbi:MAG: DUF368 domain-containing protein [Bacilli bacterium]|nr:DUF368 domain-containing protein [Bacilli bacterium]MDD4808956.1 DUF368 domain-containing protein [Bacilli bacterium]